jgi:hypothetical protein
MRLSRNHAGRSDEVLKRRAGYFNHSEGAMPLPSTIARAYVRSQEGRDLRWDIAAGLSLHPAIGDTLYEHVVIRNHPITFATVDLSRSATNVRQELRQRSAGSNRHPGRTPPFCGSRRPAIRLGARPALDGRTPRTPARARLCARERHRWATSALRTSRTSNPAPIARACCAACPS